MENDIGVDSGHDIIQYHPKSSPHFFETPDGEGFEDIEKPEENETDQNEERCLRHPEHSNEEAHHLIDDDPGIIPPSQILFSPFWNPGREEEESDQCQFVKWKWHFREEVIDRNGKESAQSPWGYGRVSDAETGSE